MTVWRRTLATAAGFLLAAALGAQQSEPTTLGVQARLTFPYPGLGGSLVMEDDFGDYFNGIRGRLDLGADVWAWKGVARSDAGSGTVKALHLGAEVVRMLRPGGDPVSLGPYVTLGAGLYQWSFTEDGVGGRRAAHGGGTVGVGWRFTKTLDGEFKVLASNLDPGTSVLALMAMATWRF